MQLSNLQKLNSKCQYIQTVIQQLQNNFNLILGKEKYSQVTLLKQQEKILTRISNKYNYQVQQLIQKSKIYDQTCQQINHQHQKYIIRKQLLMRDIQELKIFIRKNGLLSKKNSKKLEDIQSLQNQIVKQNQLINQQMKHFNLLIDQTSQLQSASNRLQNKQKQIQTEKQLIKIYERDHYEYYKMDRKYQKLRNQKNSIIYSIQSIQKQSENQTNKKLQQLFSKQEKLIEVDSYLQQLNQKIIQQNQIIEQIKRRQNENLGIKDQIKIEEQKSHKLSQIISLKKQPTIDIQKSLSPLPTYIQNDNKMAIKIKKNPNVLVNRSFQHEKIYNRAKKQQKKNNSNFNIFYQRPYDRKSFSNHKLDKQQKATVDLINIKMKESQQKRKKQAEVQKDDTNVLPSILAKKQQQQIKSKYGQLDVTLVQDSQSSSNNSKIKKYQNNQTLKFNYKKQMIFPSINRGQKVNRTQNLKQRVKSLSQRKNNKDRYDNTTDIKNLQENVKQKAKKNQSQLNIKQKKQKLYPNQNKIRYRTEGIVAVFQGLIQKQRDNNHYQKRVNNAIKQFKNLPSVQTINKKVQDGESVKITAFTSGNQSDISRKKHGVNVNKGSNLQRQSNDEKDDDDLLVTISEYYQKQEQSIQQPINNNIYLN